MSPRDDDHLPDELRDIADGIRESRHEPTPLELDELKRRARRQAERGSGSILVWRKKLIAAILALGLMFSSGAGVVVAAQSIGKKSGKQKLGFKGLKKKKKDASKSQYCNPTQHDDSDSDSARDRDSDSDCDSSDSDDSDRPRGGRGDDSD
jgi:hypothetical protein